MALGAQKQATKQAQKRASDSSTTDHRPTKKPAKGLPDSASQKRELSDSAIEAFNAIDTLPEKRANYSEASIRQGE
jgi:hypothetical protein